jgi:transcriptional regulator with XRE-family HTH domain
MDETSEPLDPVVADLIRVRKAKKLRQEDLAAAAGISRRALVMIEGGGDCSLSTLRRLFSVLGMDLEAKGGVRPTLDDLNRELSDEFSARTQERPRG